MQGDGGRISPEALETIQWILAHQDGVRDNMGGIEWVYLVQMTGTNLYKIGKTNQIDPRHRINALGRNVNLIYALPYGANVGAERAMHRHFRDQWVSGEWFDLSSDDVTLFINGAVLTCDDSNGRLSCACHGEPPSRPSNKTYLVHELVKLRERLIVELNQVEEAIEGLGTHIVPTPPDVDVESAN